MALFIHSMHSAIYPSNVFFLSVKKSLSLIIVTYIERYTLPQKLDIGVKIYFFLAYSFSSQKCTSHSLHR